MKRAPLKPHKKRPVLRGFCITLAVLVAVFLVLELGVFALHFYKDAYYPEYEQEDISSVLEKENLSDDDYSLLFEQTGLTRLGVDSLISEGRKQDILKIQEDYFGKYEVKKIQFSPLTCCHENYEEIETAPLQNGDVIISPTSHFSFFAMGHSAIVVDSEEGKVVNSTGYNNKSCYEDISAITVDPSFIVLRPKLESETRLKIAEYVKAELLDLPYSVSVGILFPKYSEKPIATNCSHLIWHAFKTFDVDIDSNGGMVVMPMDIALSEHFEIVQIRGIDPESIGIKI